MAKDLSVDFEQLRTAVDWSIRQLGTPRLNRIKAIKQYVGSHYSDGGASKKVPTNFLELAITIYTHQLAARAPTALITTGNPSLRPFAKSTEIAVNQVPDEIDLGATLQKAVVEALFFMGVVKVGIASSGVQILGHDYGEPFVDIVSPDDYFCDMTAKTREGIQFEGNDYWIPLETAREKYGNKSLEADEYTITGDQGEERAEAVTSGEGADLYKEKVWLRDVWLPREGKLCTYGVKSLKQLAVVDWDGPEHGPYHMLGYTDVPGNLLPLPPVALWYDLHELANILYRKLGRQADAKKTVAAFPGGNDESVKRLKNANDGDGVHYSGQKPESITVGGIDAPTLAFFIQNKDLFSYLAGNLDTMGGLAAASETVGQDKILEQAAGARLNHMRGQTIKFAKGIFESLFWYEWTDPVRERTVEKPVSGTDISVKSVWSEETREGNFLDYNFDIDVFSMQDDTPSTKLQKIGQALDRFVFPVLDVLREQGGQIDFKVLLALVGKLANVPELQDIVTFGALPEGTPVQSGEASHPTKKPNDTTRNYVRTSRSGATRSGKDAALTQLLLGGNPQQSEVASIGKPSQ